ncbi:hypothetical protein ACFLU6_14340, partial [Acidobacteriota bacterium]
KEKEMQKEEKVSLKLNVMNLIMQGIREMDAGVLQAHYLPPKNGILIKKWDAEELTRSLNLTSLELKFLDMIQNGSTIGENLYFPFLGKRDSVRTLYGMLTVGLIRVIGYRKEKGAVPPVSTSAGNHPAETVSRALYEKLVLEKRIQERELKEKKEHHNPQRIPSRSGE